MTTPINTAEYRLSTETKLRAFIAAALVKVGVGEEEARTVGEILVSADVRGIESHGSARLVGFYVARIRAGVINPRPDVTIVRETATTLVLDNDNGLGHPVSKRAMLAAIEKAKTHGTGFATVRNSNHYGIAGYYAMLALDHDVIGICSTNAVRYGAATYGKDIMLGTNPWAYAIPAEHEPAFVLDFATTTVPRGRLEVFQRKGKALEPGWAIDATGRQTLDPAVGLASGALLPLGGLGITGGGHKGYGLGLLADIMCGVLAGGPFGTTMPLPNDPPGAGMISHFFGALSIAGFRDPAAFKADMDRELRMFKDSQKAPGAERIYVAGEIEHERTLHNRKHGVPIHVKVWTELEALAGDLAIPFALGRDD